MAVTDHDTATATATWQETLHAMDWRQGEHVTLIGPTGRGKTELITELLRQRIWSLFLGTKRIDSTQDKLRSELGFRTVKTASGINPEIASRFILRPPFPRATLNFRSAHKDAFRRGLVTAYRQTGWTIAVDEARYICEHLGLRDEMMVLWLQGRSQGNSIICGTQRSRHVPLEAYSQATHLFMWSDPDESNVKRNAELAAFDGRAAARAMSGGMMGKHDVLYVNAVSGDMHITNTRW